MSQREQVAVTSRVFCLAALLGVALILRDAATIQTVAVILVVGGLSTYVSYATGGTALVTLTGEALVVSLVMGLSFDDSAVLMPYLVVLGLLAGLFRGVVGILVVSCAQVVGLLLVPLASGGLDGIGQRAVALAPWVLTTLGGGLLGLWTRSMGPGRVVGDSDEQYESARQLLTQLRAVARRLSAGLDSAGMAAELMETLHAHLDDRYSAVFVRTSGSILVPIGFRGIGAGQVLSPTDPIVERCWEDQQPIQGVVPSGNRDARHRVALPLRVGTRMIGVAFSSSSEPAATAAVEALMRETDAHSLRLETALVFDEIRSMATSDERQRLAREIHDGIAQEVASLGYVVDHLAFTTSDPEVSASLRDLRGELSRVVADLRLSIFDLRSDVSPTIGLGSALSDYVRQVGAKSDLTVHLTLDEAPTRLAPDVEGELLRIAQEAVTNARKHAAAENLWVDFWSEPPRARLVVRDDGTGMGSGRDDSYGISIMRERAERIDATLQIHSETEPSSERGTVVQVTVAATSLLSDEGIKTP
ncbi:MAG: histidine kinase [Nocardioidaceae bacterium]